MGREFVGVHRIFEGVAARQPAAIAAIRGGERISYGELNAWAEAVSCALMGTGARSNGPVAVLFERSFALLAALLGVLKAGGAVVPLDPALPRGRIAAILDDTEAPLLGSADLAARFELSGFIPLPERGRLGRGAEVTTLHGPPVGDDPLAYILYTSGSTGRPKGISFPHAALINLIHWHNRAMVPVSRVLNFASIGFDASFHEIFAAWCYGGAIVLIDDEQRKDPVALGRVIAEQRVEKVILPVVVLQELAEAYSSAPRELRRLREVTTTGEAMHLTPAVIELFRGLPRCALHNHYGPTESHVVTSFTLSGDPRSWPARPPIGRPIANARVLILNERLEPCPSGEIGEIYIGGACLARGYWRRPELTAERFIADPTAVARGEVGARLYASGDLGRVGDDGVIVYLGRRDRQLKIKGVRVELGEIEGVLGGLAGVRGAAVEHLEGRLYAYVTLRDGTARSGEELLRELRETLPEAMIPRAIVILEELPLTANGKLDRAALAGLRPGAPSGARGRTATAERDLSEVEARMLAVWRDALRCAEVAPEDDFLALGGDSLAAARLIARTRRVFGVDLGYREVFSGLSPAALLARIDARPSVDGGELRVPAAARASVSARDRAPLTSAQARLWFLRKMAPESRAYHLCHAFRIRGAVATERLVRALGVLLQRHPALRTAFVEEGAEAVQRIVGPSQAAIERLTMSEVGVAERQVAIDEQLAAEFSRPLDLEGGVPARLGVLRLAEDDHLIWLHLHHIVADGWSEALLLRELGELCSAGGSSLGEPPAARYVDYAAELRLAEGDDGRRERDARVIETLRGHLIGAPALLQLPWDRPRPVLQGPRSASHSFGLGPREVLAIRDFALAAGATTAMVIMAGWAALLHRYSSARKLAIGVPSAGRGSGEFEEVVGLFVNTLVVPVEVASGVDFAGLTANVRERCLEAFEGESLPFERLVSALSPERDLSYNPIVQVGFAPQPDAARTPRIEGLQVEALGGRSPHTPMDLTLFLWEGSETIELAISFDQDLFERATIERMEGHLRRLMMTGVRAPRRSVAALPMLSAAERQQAIYGWNETSATGERRISGELLHTLVERVASERPEQIAACQGGASVSYGGLDRRANALAWALRERGVRRGDRVALAVDRSIGLLVGVLGILKAGAAFVPVDPAYPEARRSYMIGDSEAALIVTQEQLAPSLGDDVPLLILGEGGEAEASEAPEVAIDPQACAYMIYTSGSTGTPKGVMVAHRGAVNLARAQLEMCRLSLDSVVLQFSSLSFDALVFELLAAWGVGATIALPPPGPVIPGAELVALLRARRVSYWVCPPSVLAAMPEAELPELEVIVAAGERCTAAVVDRWAPGRTFINAYGPTEVTVCATYRVCCAGEGDPSIGRPLLNVEVYILDGEGEPAAVGLPGEIVIGGLGVALGYRGRPAENAARFTADPFSGRPGALLYRSGDRGRRLANGEIEFLGRDDEQVKIRGFRIELGEIEAALCRDPEVADAVVTASVGLTGHLLLQVAGSVGDVAETQRAVRERLQGQLPAHMVPSSLVIHARFPTLPNGKIDRRALAELRTRSVEGHDLRRGGPGASVTSGIAATLAQIWCDVLGLADVDHDASFFEVGGHSLALAEIQGEIAERLGTSIRIVDLFRFTTIRTLAKVLSDLSSLRGSDPAGDGLRAGEPSSASPAQDERIAIVGVAGRFPGADDADQLWANLMAGVDAIHTSSAEELAAAGVDPEVLGSPRFVPRYGLIDGAYDFDADFFGYSPQESRLIDPQHRIFLESAFAALEDAAYDPARRGRSVGVFAGSEGPYHWIEEIGRRGAPQSPTEIQVGVANIADNLTARVAYKLGLEGPAVTVLAACATSLVAVHVACRSLREGECELALAGGSAIAPPSHRGHLADGTGLMSDDGRCRPFDAEASGTVGASAVSVVALRRLSDALADGDRIYAVIRGSAIGHDGGAKIGFTAPSPRGQERVITAAYAAAGVEPESVGFIEAHGTGTRVGDPIEVAALTEAFRRSTAERGFCALGSLKGNLGHTGAASGVAGLIKAAFAVERGVIPPTVHYRAANPDLELGSSPFFINSAAVPWSDRWGPRRAGVSAFGVGGTNAHVVVESCPEVAPSTAPREWQVLRLSARTERALDERSSAIAEHLKKGEDVRLADVCYTARRLPELSPARRVVVSRSASEAAAALERPRRRSAESCILSDPELVWMFPGGGTQYVGMGRQLYAREPVFRAALDLCAERFVGPLGVDIRRLIFAEEGERAEAEAALRMPSRNTAAVFSIEHALAELLLSGGLRPGAVFGQSLGEYGAAVVAGVMSVEDAVELIALRGLLCDRCPPAAMLSVFAGVEMIEPRLGELSVAAINGPELCVIAGSEAPLGRLAAQLEGEGIRVRPLAVAGAAHSSAVEGVVPHLVERARGLDLRPPEMPMFSCVVGGEVGPRCAEAEHWGQHLRQTIRFTEAANALLAGPQRVFLEVGPSGRMAKLLRRQPGAETRVSPSAMAHPRSKRDESQALYEALGELWSAGLAVDERLFSGDEVRRVVSLPRYPFARTTYTVHGGGGRPRSAEPLASEVPAVDPAIEDPTLRAIAEVWSRILGVRPIAADDDFFALGGSSLIAMELRAALQDRLGVAVPVHALVEHPRLEAFAGSLGAVVESSASSPPGEMRGEDADEATVEAKGEASLADSLADARRAGLERGSTELMVRLRSGSVDRAPLFLIQPIGGTVYTYRALAEALGDHRTIYGVRAPGIEPGEPVFDELAPLLDAYARQVREVQPSGELLLAGHSSGGLLAFALAERFVADGRSVHVAPLDAGFPPPLDPGAPYGVDELLGELSIFKAKAPEAYAHLEATLRSGSRLAQVMVGTRRALAAFEPHRLGVNLLAFMAEERVLDDADAVAVRWLKLAGGGFSLDLCPGDHFSMLEAPRVGELARRLARRLMILA